MLGWKIFTRAVSMLVDNIGAALRVSAVPFACLVAFTLLVESLYPSAAAGVPVEGAAEDVPDPGGAILLVLAALANLALGSWAAVGWHRYVLSGDMPQGWVPRLDGGVVLGYLGMSIAVGFVVTLGVLAITTMVGVAILPLIGQAGQVVVLAAGAITAAILLFRLSIVLPARALGKPMGFNDAIRATKGHSTTAVALTALTGGVLLLLQLPPILDGVTAVADGAPVEDIRGGPGPISIVYSLVTQWIALMLGAGVLTALYGHLVEGRPVE